MIRPHDMEDGARLEMLSADEDYANELVDLTVYFSVGPPEVKRVPRWQAEAMVAMQPPRREPWKILGVHINPNTDCGAMSWVAIGDSKRTYARVGFSWRIGGSQCGDNQADREKIAQQICDAVNAMGGI